MSRGYSELPDGSEVPTSIAGSIAEHKATVWLLEQGYEVFRNVSPTGKVDLIATKDGEMTKVDVKKLSILPTGPSFRANDHEEQRARGIRFLWVHENTVGWNRDYFQF